MEDFKKHKDNLKKINLKLWEIEDKLRILEKEKNLIIVLLNLQDQFT